MLGRLEGPHTRQTRQGPRTRLSKTFNLPICIASQLCTGWKFEGHVSKLQKKKLFCCPWLLWHLTPWLLPFVRCKNFHFLVYLSMRISDKNIWKADLTVGRIEGLTLPLFLGRHQGCSTTSKSSDFAKNIPYVFFIGPRSEHSLPLPNQTYQTKPTKPNLPNQTYQTKPIKPNQT